MRILWLPHMDWPFIRRGQREFHFAQGIKNANDVSFLTWREVRPNPVSVLASLRGGAYTESGFRIHQASRLPNFFGGRLHEVSGRGLRINEKLYQRAVRQVVEREGIDIVLCGISHQAVGLPPDDLAVPLVFDYLDYKFEHWPDLETEYLERSDAVLCTSQVLVRRVEQRHAHTYYLPNGVDLDAAERADGDRVRRLFGLDGSRVVSLIGLTASMRLFYVDAIAAVARDVANVVFLLVGDGGEFGKAMHARAVELGLRTVVTGPVPSSDVADFFAATDVGLYPGEKSAYFDAASPLKVLEYTAARKPVVATDLEELRNWGFPNVRLAAPTVEAFGREIKFALGHEHEHPDLARFEWSALSQRLATILEEVRGRGVQRDA
jgi:glycosyltransferase involved in cell wall biosynthesis